MFATLFLSPSFLYLRRFVRRILCRDFCSGLARSGLVTSYALTEVVVADVVVIYDPGQKD